MREEAPVNADATRHPGAPGGAVPPGLPPRRAAPPAPRAPRTEGNARAGDRLDLSAAGALYQRAALRLRSWPDASSPRVAALRAEVARGGYRVAGETVAAALLADEATARVLGAPESPR